MIPHDKNQIPLEMVRGRTKAWGLQVKDDDGSALVLEEGQQLIFGLKKNENDENCVLTKVITNSIDGEYYLELQPADTASLAPGRYYYDVSLQQGETVLYTVVEISPFIIKHNVTKLGDGG